MVIPPPDAPPCLAQIDDDRFYLGVLLDPLVASLAAETGLFEPAERDLVGVAGRVVGADEPVLELLGHPDEPSRVARVEVGGQPELRRIGAPDHLLFRVEHADPSGRADNLRLP